jgi:hypothetical protein
MTCDSFTVDQSGRDARTPVHGEPPAPSVSDTTWLNITVVYAPAPRQVIEVALQLPPGTTLQGAINASGLCQRFADLDLAHGSVGVWGSKAPLEQPLREADRVEVWRPLRVDPKLARRERFQKQGAGQTGLFARRRPGAKSGY